MTTPGNQSWPTGPQQPVPQQPVGKKKLKPLQIVGIAVAGGLVLCCGGVGTIGAIFGDDTPTPSRAVAEQTAAPRFVAPVITPETTVPTPTRTSSPTPIPSRTTELAAAKTKPKASPTRTSTPKPRPTTKQPAPKPTKTKSPVRQGVHPGAFCSPAGARGLSEAGKPMVCKSTAADDRNRWRAA